jgi:hypothetical protein
MEKKLTFKKEKGTWYIDLPEWKGPKASLAMVAGADTMLDCISNSTNICKIEITTEPIKDFQGDGLIKKTTETSGILRSFYGQHYDAEGLYVGLIWLCPVTKFVFGDYPDVIYFKLLKAEQTGADETKTSEQEPKHQVHNLIILDESGSMSSIRKTIIAGFNELVQTIKGVEQEYPEQEHFISLVSFNSLGLNTLHYMDPVSELKEIDDSHYNPNASTPLFDAIGFSLTEGKRVLSNRVNYNVLVTIMTDGEENASKQYSGAMIKKMIEELKQQNWTFTYIGTDHDVDKIADSISINNKMKFEKNDEDIRFMFEKEKNARQAYSQKIRLKEDTRSNFYKENDENDEDKK